MSQKVAECWMFDLHYVHHGFFFLEQVTIGLYILLFLFESLPSSVILCGLVSQLVHLSILRTFPYFFLTSLPFILGIGKCVINSFPVLFRHQINCLVWLENVLEELGNTKKFISTKRRGKKQIKKVVFQTRDTYMILNFVKDSVQCIFCNVRENCHIFLHWRHSFPQN